MESSRKTNILDRLCDIFISERKFDDLLKILVFMSKSDEVDGKSSIWKMLNSLYRHSKAFKMYVFKLSSIASSKVTKAKCLRILQTLRSEPRNATTSISNDEIHDFLPLWTQISFHVQKLIIREFFGEDSNHHSSDVSVLAVCKADQPPNTSGSLVGAVTSSIKSINSNSRDLLNRVKSLGAVMVEPITTANAIDAGALVVGYTTGSCVSRGDPVLGAAFGIMLCFLFRTSFMPRFARYFWFQKNYELKKACDHLGVLPTTDERVVDHVYRRLKREAEESRSVEEIREVEESYEKIMTSRKKVKTNDR